MVYCKELKELVENDNIKSPSRWCKDGTFLGNRLRSETSFLKGKFKLSERLWYVKNNIFVQVKCPVCNNLSRVNLNKSTIRLCSIKCKNKHLDKNGLTSYQIAAKKLSITRNTVNIKTGLKLSEESSRKAAKTKSKIDPETGLTGYQKFGNKISYIKNIVNIKTGLKLSEESSRKAAKTMSKIDPITRLSIYNQSSYRQMVTVKSKMFIKLIKLFPKNYVLLTIKNEYINSNLLKYQCKKCNSIRESYWPYIRCTTCYPYNKSIAENEVLEFCQSLTNNVISNDRKLIKPLELDVYIPDFKLAIEYNGLFWHSSYSVESENKDYHLIKTQKCHEKGVQLFHIFENEWLDPVKCEIWKSIIANKLGKSRRIYARKTEIRQVMYKDVVEFLNGNHLQGNCQSSVNYGLYLDDELIALMTFGRSRYDKSVDFELLRFCNKVGYSVVGGAGRLLNAFRIENQGSIISYADKRRSIGGLYGVLGFELSHESGPSYWYWKDKGLESRIGYQKHKLKDKLDVYDSELTEAENMYANGYRRIYDCGNQVWVII